MQWLRLVAEIVPLDTTWLKANPLPKHDDDIDKNRRGIVLVIGGSRSVPGGIMLTAEAAFRAGAGKVTIATVASAALQIGIAMPECAVLALAESNEGELGDAAGADRLRQQIELADAIVLGPAMTSVDAAAGLLPLVLDKAGHETMIVLDAAAIRAAPDHRTRIVGRTGPIVMTPHAGEIAALLGYAAGSGEHEQIAAVRDAVAQCSSTVMIKGAISYVADDRSILSYSGGGIGLATGGSGDVLAGLIASLGAQGASALQAAAWGIWSHGEAGRRLAETVGPLGYLARDLLPLIPQIMRSIRS